MKRNAAADRVLAGDVGGTKVYLGLFRRERGRLAALREEKYSTTDYPSFGAVVAEFLRGEKDPAAQACIGVAGPIRDGRARTTNLPWDVDCREVEAHGVKRALLINDLAATAYGIAELDPGSLENLTPDVPPGTGNAALLAAGTGLGESILCWNGRGHEPMPSEGGHADFAPGNEVEDALLVHLRARLGHVSYERVLSGPGLLRIYQFLRDSGRGKEQDSLAEEMRLRDPGAVIGEAGLSGNCALCAAALDLFVRVYGAEAGNLALKVLAFGGVYIGGGIAPKILPALRDGRFVRAFTDKGRFAPVLEKIRVQVILDPRTALLGAARRALREAEAS